MKHFAALSICVLMCASASCSDTDAPSDPDAGVDGGIDGGVDGGVDGGLDGGVDGGVDGGTGSTSGSGGTAGTGGTPAGCEEPATPGQEQLTGQPTVAPVSTTAGTQVIAMIPVDEDTVEVLVVLYERQGGSTGGVGRATTAGDQTVSVMVDVFEDAMPEEYVVEIELRGDLANPSRYTLYGDPDETSSITYDKFIVTDNVFSDPITTSCAYATVTVVLD